MKYVYNAYSVCYNIPKGDVYIVMHTLIREIRLSLGLSQMEFSRQMHVSFSTVNRWENCRAHPNKLAIVMLIKLCQQKQVCEGLISELQRLCE